MERLEMDYSYEAKWNEYLLQQSINEAQLDRYIGECLVFSENTNVYDRLVAINEAISDKITSAWDKIMDFLRRMWGKFTETLNSILAKDTTYLEKYKDIILSKPIKAFAQVSMFDLTQGEKNIANTVVMVPDTAIMEQIPVKVGENDETRDQINAMRTRLVTTWANGKPAQNPEGKEWQQWLVDFFKGALGGEKNYNADSLDIRGMYQYCMNKSKLLSILEKDKKNIETASKEFADEAKKYATDSNTSTASGKNITGTEVDGEKINADDIEGGEIEALVTINGKQSIMKVAKVSNNRGYVYQKDGKWIKINADAVEVSKEEIDKFRKAQATGGTNTTDTKATPSPDKKGGDENKQTDLHASANFVYSSVYNTYFNEVEFNQNGTSSSTSNGNNGKTAAAVAQKNSVDNNKGNNVEALKSGSKYTTEQITNKATNWITACRDVLTAKMTATEYIHKEYMTIIKAHVAYYVGRKNIEDNRNAPDAQSREKENANQQAATGGGTQP